MATKTLTITENAYHLLANRKLRDESFSEELVRILSKKKVKKIRDFFGILAEKEWEAMLHDIKMINSENVRLLKKRVV